METVQELASEYHKILDLRVALDNLWRTNVDLETHTHLLSKQRVSQEAYDKVALRHNQAWKALMADPLLVELSKELTKPEKKPVPKRAHWWEAW